ncbi:MAG TPA: 2-isopropylmalate synthase [Gaiellaceae bacterium]|nr:2-isopropylmalate synthase [Gaiellaceae bacterium]
MRRIHIFDTTLRDGEQSPGIALRPDEKGEIAAALERLGVDVVEAGFAVSSPGDFEGVAAVAQTAKHVTVASLARTTAADIDAAVAALRGAPRSRVHLFIATSKLHMERKLGLRPEEVLERVSWSVAYAARRADEVEFSAEDATRSDRGFLAQVCRAAVAAGADVVNLPDTVGYATPAEYASLFEELLEAVPELAGAQLSVHCHNDLGLAVANSLAGADAGAVQVECTINGIGERAGNASLEEIVMALRVRPDVHGAETGIDPRHIRDTSDLVAELTGYPVGPNKPIVGANAFAHEAGIHQDGMLKDAATYQIIDPTELGTSTTLPLGKHSGRHAFARACADAGRVLAKHELDQAFRRFKKLADLGVPVTLDDVLQEVHA